MNDKCVAVLMSTYNGAEFLSEQLDSVMRQQRVRVKILVRDDGSSDSTLEILEDRERRGELSYYCGQNIGPALSFMHLVASAPPADFFAFCDQDDVWLPDKLAAAVEKLSALGSETPALYFSNLTLVDAEKRLIRETHIRPQLTLGAALVVNEAAGCTIVFNNALLTQLRRHENPALHMHDAWVYRVCLALGGSVVFDDSSHIYYRQHATNTVGGMEGWLTRGLRRVSTALIDRERIREKDAAELIRGYGEEMSPANRELVQMFVEYRHDLRQRWRLLTDDRIQVSSIDHKLAFLIAVLFGFL